jgi:hypothetical protein
MKVYVGSAIWRSVEAEHHKALIPLLRQPNVQYAPQVGDALMERTRSISATYFLRHTDADVHLSIDSDIVGFTVEDTLRMCELAEQYDVVGANYIGRSRDRPQPFVQQFIGEPIVYAFDHTPVPVKWLATGFLAIHRRVFEKLAEGLTLLHASKPFAFYNFYGTCEYEDDELGEPILLSEDYAICHRAREAGFGIYVDPAVRVGHMGTYTYRLEDMAQKPLEPQPVQITRTAPYSWRMESYVKPEEPKPDLWVPREEALNRKQRRALTRA